MKKRLLPITILAALGMSALVGCGGSAPAAVVDVTGVTLNKTTVDIVKGQTEQLTATIAPTNATDKTVTWKSADTSVATVADGLVSALDVGSTKVTVTTNDGGFKAECTVNVVLAMNSITISNKAAFAEGLEVGSNKAVAVSGDPAINAADLANKGYLTIASSDTTVATTNKLVVYAVKAGTTTITATLFGKSDSFQLTVKEISNKDKFGTDHEGDAADPFTNEDALKAAKWLENNGGYGTTKYYVKGEVDYFYHNPGERTDKVVSYFLKPATAGGEQFEVYKTLKSDGSALTDADIWAGGIATAYGAFTKYGTQYETDAATFVSCEGTAPAARAAVAMTFAEALAAGKACKDGAATYDMPSFEAYVTVKSGKDFFLTATKDEAVEDKKANTIQLYQPAEDIAAYLLKGAKVKVTNSMKNYHGQVENLFALTTANVELIEAGEPWEKPVPEFLSIVTNPVVGTKYKLGLKVSARGDDGDIFMTGVKDGNFGTTTAKFDDGVDAELVAAATEGKYNVKLTYKDNSVKYLNAAANKNSTYLSFDDEASTEYTYDTEANTLFFVSNGHTDSSKDGEYYFGTYNTYVTISCSMASYINKDAEAKAKVDVSQFPLHFCTKGERPALESVVVSPAESDVDLYGKDAAQVVDLAAAPSPKTAELGEVTWSTDKADKGVTVAAGKVTIPLDFVAEDATDDITVTAAAGGKSGTAVIHVKKDSSGGGGGDTYKDAAIAKGTGKSYDDATVNGKPAIKCGTSSAGGTALITVGQGATELRFHACAWKGSSSAAVTLSYGETTLDPISILADDGLSNNSPFTLVGSESSFELVVTLSGITAETVITVSCNVNRFAIWGAQYK